MTRHHLAGISCAVLAILCLWPAAARAQSAFTGVVKDTSGAVLPGVTVEAASPVAHREDAVGRSPTATAGTASSICGPASTR